MDRIDRRMQMSVDAAPYVGNRKVWFEERRHGVGKTKKKTDLPLLVIGTGRCGTTWLAKSLQAAGFDIGHETVRSQGTVSLFFAVDSDWHPWYPWEALSSRRAHIGERRSDFKFNTTIQIVRHPLKCAPSMQGFFRQLTYGYWYEHGVTTLDPKERVKPIVYRDLRNWIDVVMYCFNQAEKTYTLEELSKEPERVAWKPMLDLAGLGYQSRPTLPPKNKAHGYLKRSPLTWSDVDNIDRLMGKTLRKMCRKLRLE